MVISLRLLLPRQSKAQRRASLPNYTMKPLCLPELKGLITVVLPLCWLRWQRPWRPWNSPDWPGGGAVKGWCLEPHLPECRWVVAFLICKMGTPLITSTIAFPFSRGSSQPRIKPRIKPRSLTLQADSLPAEPQGKPKNTEVGSLFHFQQIFPTQESNQGFLYYRQILYPLSYQGSLILKKHFMILWYFC